MLRIFHHWFSGKKLALFLTESVAITVAAGAGSLALAMALAPAGEPLEPVALWPLVITLGLATVVALQLALYAFDLYDLRVARVDRRGGERMLKAVGAAVVVVALLALVAPLELPTGSLIGAAAGAVLGVLAVRSAMSAVVGEPARVMIVGNGPTAHAVRTAVEEGGEDGYTICATWQPTEEEPSIYKAARRRRCDYVVMAPDDARGLDWGRELFRCRVAGMRCYDASGFTERVLRRLPVNHLRLGDLALADEITVSRTRKTLKRTFDVLVASTLLLLALPLLAVVTLLIKLDSRGPVFYRQERVGQGGRSYFLWKFRSMRTDAEKDGAVWARQNDDRVTRVGKVIRKTRIDEIPQVINVLMGDMSFVGPRPERPVFVEQLKEKVRFYELREAVKPGITGWAQIRYPYGASVEDSRNKLEYDLYYVKNGSLFLDVAIIFHTVRHVLFGRGAR